MKATAGAVLLVMAVASAARSDPATGTRSADEIAALAARNDPAVVSILREEVMKGGPNAAEALQAAVAKGTPESIALAREVLSWRNPAGNLYVVMGLQNVGTQDALDVLRTTIPLLDPMDQARGAAELGWARSFELLHGDQSFSIAVDALKNRRLSAIDRALYVMVLGTKGIPREQVIAAYRPYLRDPAPEVRRAAIRICRRVRDIDASDTLRELEDGTDPKERLEARYLLKSFLLWGPDGPTDDEPYNSRSFQARHPTYYDPAGLAAWQARDKDWGVKQSILLTGKPPAPAQAPPPDIRVRPAGGAP